MDLLFDVNILLIERVPWGTILFALRNVQGLGLKNVLEWFPSDEWWQKSKYFCLAWRNETIPQKKFILCPSFAKVVDSELWEEGLVRHMGDRPNNFFIYLMKIFSCFPISNKSASCYLASIFCEGPNEGFIDRGQVFNWHEIKILADQC